ncbi:uncharacterized protein LOC130453107 [Diorhabda sublineata]|uniref:uncharacterized protein LOC130453107 n=1 Tax=Diorhabda sublineata TaxID=1163346 RepID=UPI0024E0F0E7|nr:uncharacterized protein LOC130453107 [Diorhabda sublineata]
MLLFRSIPLEVFLLLLLQHACTQEEYGLDSSEYHSEDDGESHGHPDYSKYYNVDAPSQQSIPLAGFVGSSDFPSFFAPQAVEYAGSNKKPLTLPPINFVPQQQQTQSLPIFSQTNQATNFPARDYFEEAQNKQLQQEQQQIKEDYIKPGPNYISYQLPLLSAATANADDVERIPPRPNQPKKSNSDESDIFKNEDEETEKEIAQKNDAYLGNLNSKPFVNYNTGKSSSTVSQYPSASGVLDIPSSQLSPYQKYSFQPIVQASRVLPSKYYDTGAPFNPSYQKKTITQGSLEGQETEGVPSPSHLNNHNCRKLSSSSLENCFECVNDETQSKYTQCSYTSDKKPSQYNNGFSERYSAPSRDDHYRYRRYTDKKDDPYYIIRNRSIKGFTGIPDDYSAGFQYEPESYDESSPELSYSEKQSEELKKNPQNCQKVEKEGSTCTVCKDPASGANFEQCSYTSAPSEKKYAYVKEKKYDSNDDPEETKTITKVENAPSSTIAPSETKVEPRTATKHTEPIAKQDQTIQQKSPKKRNDDPLLYENYKKNRDSSRARYENEKLNPPLNFADSIVKESREQRKESENDRSSKDFDEYHFKLFPELAPEESKNEETREEEEGEAEEYRIPESTKQNVEEVLAEFTKKDRSNCKKSEKNGMTCFLCVDKNKLQHEECMYVQESRPQSTHVAYHQLKGIKKIENDGQPNESQNKPILTEAEKNQLLKKETGPESLQTSASEGVEKKVPYKVKKNIYKKKRSAKKGKKKAAEAEPTIKTPAEFDVGNEEGAFSAETKPAFSKLHGVQLPKYMVEKSEYEKEFDAFSGAH